MPDRSEAAAGSGVHDFPVETHRLDNGLKIVLLDRPELPLLSLTFLVGAGVTREPLDRAGLSQITASLLPRGTARRDAVRLAEDVDALGASLGVHSDYDFSTVGLSCLSGDQGPATEILAEVVRSPAFAAEEVERKRSDILSAIERQKDDLSITARNRLLVRLFGDHPYRSSRLGTMETVSAIDGRMIQDFHAAYYRPNNAILAVSGRIEPRETLSLLEQRFGDWEPGRVPQLDLPAMIGPPGLQVDRIQKDDVAQATLQLGLLGISRNDPDYVSTTLLNYVLGGSGFGSRLMRSLREEQGLTYGAYSAFVPRREGGFFLAGCQTGHEHMNRALAALIAEIVRLREEGITAEELDWAKSYFTGSLPLAMQTNEQLAALVLEKEFFGLPHGFWIKELEQMRETPLEVVNQAARRYLHPERAVIVALADFRGGELVVPGAS